MGRKSRAKKLRSLSNKSRSNTKKMNLASNRRLIKRIVITCAITIFCFVTAYLGYSYLQTTIPISFSAQLSNTGDASFSYGTKQSDTYSPACGCMADKSERWRGITFSSRHFRLSNTTNARQTAFWISASEPGTLQWYPGIFRPQIKVLRLLVRNDTEPKISELIKGKGSGIRLVDQLVFEQDEVEAIVSNNPIEIRLLGSNPVVAYLPVEFSTITLSQPETTFKTEWNHTTIRESYENSSKFVDLYKDTLAATDLAYPMIDMIGTSVIISDDPHAVFVSASKTSYPIPNSDSGWHGLFVLTVESPFSTRITMMPLGRDFIGEINDKSNKPDFQNFSSPNLPFRPLEPDEVLCSVGGDLVSLPTGLEERGDGLVEITILEHLSSSEYYKMRDKLKENDKVDGRMRSRVAELDNLVMEFRYPALPPIDGFNIFGLLKELTIHVENGSIMVGASSFLINAPSILELRNIKAYTSKGNVIPIPLLVNTKEQSLKFGMKATSELFINSEPIVIRADQLRLIIKIISFGSLLIGTLTGLLTIFSGIKKNSKSF